MPIQRVLTKGRVPVKIYTDEVDPEALRQLYNLAQLPFIQSHVAAMPDVHAGIGATVGSVIPTRAAIIPAAVGVDIGCGMNAIRLSCSASALPDNLRAIRDAIEAAVPCGKGMHSKIVEDGSTLHALSERLEPIVKRHPRIMQKRHTFARMWSKQLGTLGSGNHFIEVCIDEEQRVWLMLHSGSRGVGNLIGSYFMALARKDMGAQIGRLPDANLAYLEEGTRYFDDYIHAVSWAQDYALANRRQMLRLVLQAIRSHLPAFTITDEAIECHHNYVARETHFGERAYVTRKGAIRAGAGEWGIIPGSMGAKSYIVRGKGNPQSFQSCAHGAGRRMSRGDARRRFSTADLAAQTEGVECRKDNGVVDEAPGAYKDIDRVMEQQHDLVEIIHTLRQVVCVKG